MEGGPATKTESGTPRQASDGDPFAKFRTVFSGYFSEAHHAQAQPSRRYSRENAASDNVMEFSSAIYYCDEGDGAVELEVIRLGNPDCACCVEYITRDRSAVAGIKYVAARGFLEFAEGESSKVLRIGILEDQSFDATLEFEVLLTRAFNAELGAYLRECRVLICDNDAFPTNRFSKQLLANKVGEVPQWPLMFEFWRMNMADRTFRARAVKNMLGDQVSNLNYVLTTFLMNFLIDHILRPADGSPPPDNAAEMVWVIVAIGVAPHVIMWALDHFALRRRVKGMVVARLQANLLRKFLNYNEASRNVVSTSDLIMAITRDAPELAQDGLVTCFGIAKNIGLLAILSVLAIRQMGSARYIAIGIFLGAPLSMILFLACRHHGTSVRRKLSFRRQTELVGYLQQTIDCYRLIADYSQVPSVINSFAEKIKTANDASLRAALWEMTNQHFAPLMQSLICGSFILLTFSNVLNGGPLGEFVTGVAICTKIGQCYERVYRQILSIEQAMASLHNIVFYMNLPVDVPERMKNTRRLLEEAQKLRRQAMARRQEGGPGVVADHEQPQVGKVAASAENDRFVEDSMLIVGKGVTFAYPRFSGGGNCVLQRASFSIAQGRLVAVTGPRLGGKATLLHLLGGIAAPSPESEGFLFMPPHLRVLHVSFQPQLIHNLNLFENLCFGPSDGEDEDPERVLAICKRLRMSQSSLLLVKADCGHVSHAALVSQMYNQSSPKYMGKHSAELELMGSPASVANRHMAELAANQTALLSHTDKCIMNLARALIMNPDVLVLHKPLSHFDDLQASLVLEILRNFVDNRGVETPPETRELRRPRTCIFSTATTKCTDTADLVLHVGHGVVEQVDNLQLALLRQHAKDLFKALGSAGSGVTRTVFLDAFLAAPWAHGLLGVKRWDTSEGPQDRQDLEAQLSRAFDALDKVGSGVVDYEALVSFLGGSLDMRLPEMLASVQGRPVPVARARTWEVPPVPAEAGLQSGLSAEPGTQELAHTISCSHGGLPLAAAQGGLDCDP